MKKYLIALLLLIEAVAIPEVAFAHGERAQQAGLRMRTVHWFDTAVSTTKLNVNDTLVVSGSFVPSVNWPEHMAGPDGTAFLNIGVPGPTFVRLDSRVNGMPMIRSTRFYKGQTYQYSVTLKARTPGRYHVHPVLSVKGTGPVIGPGFWVEVGGSQSDFVNTVKTMTGETIDLETYGMGNIAFWSVLWFGVGLVWFIYWLTKCPILIPRFRRVADLGDKADDIITPTDKKVAASLLAVTLSLIGFGYFWAQDEYPITTPLQTGIVHVPEIDVSADREVDVAVVDARYRIPGRSFELTLDVKNRSAKDVSLGNLTIANVRFVDPAIIDIKPVDAQDLVASGGLRVEGGAIKAGESARIKVFAEDALWETYRLTSLIYDPDSRFGAMLYFYADDGARDYAEVGGSMLPVFM